MRIATFILALTANAAITKSNSNSKKNDDGSSNSINSNSGKIISRSSVFTDLFATKDSRFDVRFVSASSTAPAADDTSILTTATFSVSLNSGNGIPTFFRCAIPAKSNSQNSTLQPPRSPDDDDDELASEEELALQHAKRNVWKGLEMLKGLEAHCLYFVHGWWTYEFCHQRYMRQYHPRSEEEEKRFPEKRQDYFLGKRPTPPSNTNIEYIVDDNDQGFLSMQYTDGTPCSITGNTPRKTEVHFHCVPGSLDTIVSVQETASCVYKVHIATSRLCNDDAFVAKTHELKGDSVVISCEDISGENHKIEGAYTGNSGLVLRQFANIDGGRFSLEKLYPEVVQRVVTAPSASLQILGQPTAILEDAALVNKVKEAISKLTAIDSNGKPYPGKLPTTKSATPPGNANEPIKVVELVIDENGNIVFDGDAETVLREFFGGTDVVANKLVGDRTIPAVDDQHDEFDRLHKEHLKQHSQQHQQNMDQHQQFLQEQEEAIQQFLHKQRLQQEIKRYQDQQKLSERRQQPESHLAANEEKAASESSSYSSSSSTSSSSTTSETFLDGVTVSKSVQAEIASKHTVTKDGEIIQEENYGAAASADSRHGVNGKNVPIEILTADGEEIDPKMLQKLLEMMQRAAGGTVTASSGTIRSSRSDDNESNDDGESESATVERRNKGTTDSGDAETQLTEKLQKQRKGEEL